MLLSRYAFNWDHKRYCYDAWHGMAWYESQHCSQNLSVAVSLDRF